MNSVKKYLVILIAILMTVSLTGCLGNNSSEKALPTPSTTSEPTEAPDETEPFIGNGLYLPPRMPGPLPMAIGPGVDKFEKKYVQDAFTYGIAVIYGLNDVTDLFEPNLSKSPEFIPSLKLQLQSFHEYFYGEMKTAFVNAIPDIIEPLDKDGNYKASALSWQTILFTPPRSSDGRLLNPAGDPLRADPWDGGVSVGAPIADVTTIDQIKGYDEVLSLRFTWTMNIAYSPTYKGKPTSYRQLTKELTLYMIPNPDQEKMKFYPWVIIDALDGPVQWGERIQL